MQQTSRAFVFIVKVSNCAHDFPVYSLYFSTSPVKTCTCTCWRSRSSLICFNSSRRHLSSFAKISFCFAASSCEAWEEKGKRQWNNQHKQERKNASLNYFHFTALYRKFTYTMQTQKVLYKFKFRVRTWKWMSPALQSIEELQSKSTMPR